MKAPARIRQGFQSLGSEPVISNIVIGGFLAMAFLTNIFEIARMLILGVAP